MATSFSPLASVSFYSPAQFDRVHNMNDTTELIKFFHFLQGLKQLERYKDNVFWRDYDWITRWESVADHTWRMAMILVVIEKRLARPIDLAKALKICLVHDLPEIIAGDPSPLGSDGTGRDSHRLNPEVKAKKFQEEEAAARKIFAMLPGSEGDEYYNLWLEYEEQSSYEAKIVKGIDKVEAKLQVIDSTGCRTAAGFIEPMHEIGYDEVQFEPILKNMMDELLEYFDQHYIEFKKES